MSPIQHLPEEEADPTSGDLHATARSFVDALAGGRITQLTTVHRWAAELRRALDDTPPPEPRPRKRWNRQETRP